MRQLLTFFAMLATAGVAAAAEANMQYFVTPSNSMLPAIKTGQLLGVDLNYYRRHAIKQEEVVVFMPPFASEAPYVKRVIAVPGDRLVIRNGLIIRNGSALKSNGSKPLYDLELRQYAISVDGVPLDAKNAIMAPRAAWHAADRVPDGCYLMLGDNRNDSKDSHIWGFLCPDQAGLAGTKPHILGRVLTKMVPI